MILPILVFSCSQTVCELVSLSGENEVQSDDDDPEEEDQCPRVSNSDAIRMFEQCLTWLEQQPEATVYNTTVLRELHSLEEWSPLNKQVL